MEATSFTASCPVSGHTGTFVFAEIRDVPTLCNALSETRKEALHTDRGDLRLAHAPMSGHVFNIAFDPDRIRYSTAYENSLHFSPRFQRYATRLADRLIDTYGIRKKTIVDIGCGKGDFLELICSRGENRGIGYDPSYEPDPHSKDEQSFSVVRNLYTEDVADHPADLVCCLHVLEHVQDPIGFMQRMRRAIGDQPDTVVYIEVPNALFTLREVAIWDLIYEHYSYFTPASLVHLFQRTGFRIRRLEEAFQGQYLQVDLELAEPDASAAAPEAERQVVAEAVNAFPDRHSEKQREWQTLFSGLRTDDRKTVLWGAGSKGITILNTVREAPKAVSHIVDINPRKQGRFVPGVGTPVVAPSDLLRVGPEVVVLMNGVYETEIRDRLRDLGLQPQIVVAT